LIAERATGASFGRFNLTDAGHDTRLEVTGRTAWLCACPRGRVGIPDLFSGRPRHPKVWPPIPQLARHSCFGLQQAFLRAMCSGSSAWDKVQWPLGASYGYQKGWVEDSWVVPGFSQAFEPVAGNNLFGSEAIAWIRQSAVFGELRYEPVERLNLTAGARWYFYSRTDALPES
jgi:hypothetical protein